MREGIEIRFPGVMTILLPEKTNNSKQEQIRCKALLKLEKTLKEA